MTAAKLRYVFDPALFAHDVTRWMEMSGYTYQQAADALGLNKSVVWRAAQGRMTDLDVYINICRAMKTNPFYYWIDTEGQS